MRLFRAIAALIVIGVAFSAGFIARTMTYTPPVVHSPTLTEMLTEQEREDMVRGRLVRMPDCQRAAKDPSWIEAIPGCYQALHGLPITWKRDNY